jgi:hypothetical protein
MSKTQKKDICNFKSTSVRITNDEDEEEENYVEY